MIYRMQRKKESKKERKKERKKEMVCVVFTALL
jgi:hypothetical protein